MPRNADNPANKYIGLSEADAISQIKADGHIPRIAGRDGQPFMVTCDFRRDRVNLVISGGRVVSANIG